MIVSHILSYTVTSSHLNDAGVSPRLRQAYQNCHLVNGTEQSFLCALELKKKELTNIGLRNEEVKSYF